MVISYHKTNKALKLYFRRLYIYVFKSNKEHDPHPHTLYECLEKPDRRYSRTWIVIATIPACCLCLLLSRVDSVFDAVRQPIASAVQEVKNNVMPLLASVQETEADNGTTVGYKGLQLQATTVEAETIPENLTLPIHRFQKDYKGLLHMEYISSLDIVRGHLANQRRVSKRMQEQKNVFTPHNLGIEEAATMRTFNKDNRFLPPCTVHHDVTAKMKRDMALTIKKFEQLSIPKDAYPMVKHGGYYKPPNCSSRHKVAIIVPYRNQSKCLTAFLFNIHPFLMNQNLEYRVFIIEQYGNRELNRGRLFNAGFKEAEKYGVWKCVVFHDVNLLPLSGRILYTCPIFPRQMSTIIVASNGTIMNTTQSDIYGSVTAMTVKHFYKINGYSNLYWGWNIQEHDLSLRLHHARIRLVRYSRLISKYVLLPGETEHLNNTRVVLLVNAAERYRREGLEQLQYRVVTIKHSRLHTHIVVDIDDQVQTM